MMTEKLFYQDSHRSEFDAEVLACEEAGDKYAVILDRTAFFPEGGGQYADPGYLNDVEVLDVQERDGMIRHMTRIPLTAGTKIHGRIDWEERFERMQQHTGEHIISGLVHKKFGYDNVGFHLGADYCTMDFNGPITPEQLQEIEWEANKAVFENLDIQVLYPSREELKNLDYRSKIEIEGQVRIIHIPGYDMCACCAPHLNKTGEIGLIKLVNMDHYKGGERIYMLCGYRALRDYRIKEQNVRSISTLLCAKEYEAAGAVEHLKEEQKQLKEQLVSMQQRMLRYRAAEISTEDQITIVFDASLSGSAPREMMNLLLEKGARICAVFAGSDEKGYRYVIGSRTEDVRPVGKYINEKFQGRGGGKPEMVQGSLNGTEEEIRKSMLES